MERARTRKQTEYFPSVWQDGACALFFMSVERLYFVEHLSFVEQVPQTPGLLVDFNPKATFNMFFARQFSPRRRSKMVPNMGSSLSENIGKNKSKLLVYPQSVSKCGRGLLVFVYLFIYQGSIFLLELSRESPRIRFGDSLNKETQSDG